MILPSSVDRWLPSVGDRERASARPLPSRQISPFRGTGSSDEGSSTSLATERRDKTGYQGVLIKVARATNNVVAVRSAMRMVSQPVRATHFESTVAASTNAWIPPLEASDISSMRSVAFAVRSTGSALSTSQLVLRDELTRRSTSPAASSFAPTLSLLSADRFATRLRSHTHRPRLNQVVRRPPEIPASKGTRAHRLDPDLFVGHPQSRKRNPPRFALPVARSPGGPWAGRFHVCPARSLHREGGPCTDSQPTATSPFRLRPLRRPENGNTTRFPGSTSCESSCRIAQARRR